MSHVIHGKKVIQFDELVISDVVFETDRICQWKTSVGRMSNSWLCGRVLDLWSWGRRFK